MDLQETNKERGYVSKNTKEVMMAYDCFQELKKYGKDLKEILKWKKIENLEIEEKSQIKESIIQEDTNGKYREMLEDKRGKEDIWIGN